MNKAKAVIEKYYENVFDSRSVARDIYEQLKDKENVTPDDVRTFLEQDQYIQMDVERSMLVLADKLGDVVDALGDIADGNTDIADAIDNLRKDLTK